jgi:putative aminopeptidase FrvX
LLADLLYELVQIPGPSGHEGRVAARMEAALQPYVERRYSHSPCEVVDVRDAAAAARILVGALPHIFASAEDRPSRAKEAPPPA